MKIGYLLLGIVPSDTASLMLFAGVRFTLSGLILLVYRRAHRQADCPARRGDWAR